MTHCLYFKIPIIDQMQMIILFGQTNCSSFVVLVTQLKDPSHFYSVSETTG